MDMGLKYTLWKSAENAYSDKQYGTALKIYSSIGHLPQVLFNMASIHLLKNDTGNAIECLTKAIAIDKKFAIAYYQRAVCFFFNQTYHRAIADFSSVRMLLKSKTVVDYSPAGLDFKIYICEVLYNMASCYVSLKVPATAERLLVAAKKYVSTGSHQQIIKASVKFAYMESNIYTIENGLQFNPKKIKDSKKSIKPDLPQRPQGPAGFMMREQSLDTFSNRSSILVETPDFIRQTRHMRTYSAILDHFSAFESLGSIDLNEQMFEESPTSLKNQAAQFKKTFPGRNRNAHIADLKHNSDSWRQSKNEMSFEHVDQNLLRNRSLVGPPDSIRIKIFWNGKNAMTILSHRMVLLSDLTQQIRSKIQIDFDPTLLDPKTSSIFSSDSMLSKYLSDIERSQFQLRIQEELNI